MARNGKDPRTTTEKGLGWSHQRQRKALLASLVPGSRCPRCGEPMWPHVQDLDLDHVVPRSQGGAGGPSRLAHSACNRRHGGQLAQQARAAAAVPYGTMRETPDGRLERWGAYGWSPASQRW
jgi:5-methylcytosine-specific restriction endonuclease McrA